MSQQLPGTVKGRATIGALTVRLAFLSRNWWDLRIYAGDPQDPIHLERHVDFDEAHRKYHIAREACVRAQEAA